MSNGILDLSRRHIEAQTFQNAEFIPGMMGEIYFPYILPYICVHQ